MSFCFNCVSFFGNLLLHDISCWQSSNLIALQGRRFYGIVVMTKIRRVMVTQTKLPVKLYATFFCASKMTLISQFYSLFLWSFCYFDMFSMLWLEVSFMSFMCLFSRWWTSYPLILCKLQSLLRKQASNCQLQLIICQHNLSQRLLLLLLSIILRL